MNKMIITIIKTELVHREAEGDGLRLAGFNRHASEPFQFFHRACHKRHSLVCIELHHLIASALPNVGDINPNRYFPARPNSR